MKGVTGNILSTHSFLSWCECVGSHVCVWVHLLALIHNTDLCLPTALSACYSSLAIHPIVPRLLISLPTSRGFITTYRLSAVVPQWTAVRLCGT